MCVCIEFKIIIISTYIYIYEHKANISVKILTGYLLLLARKVTELNSNVYIKLLQNNISRTDNIRHLFNL